MKVIVLTSTYLIGSDYMLFNKRKMVPCLKYDIHANKGKYIIKPTCNVNRFYLKKTRCNKPLIQGDLNRLQIAKWSNVYFTFWVHEHDKNSSKSDQ